MTLNYLRHGALFLAVIPIVAGGGCSANRSILGDKVNQQTSQSDEQRYQHLRDRMVREQLEGRDIRDRRVLQAMRDVPRHMFVPGGIADSAYQDSALPLELGQTISQPYIVGYMTQALRLQGDEKVLEIGTGFGYQAAVLSRIVPRVFTIEILPELAERARAILEGLGYDNVQVRTGDGYRGWPEEAPFDCIIVTAAPDHVPQPLVDQLKEGGRMIIPVGGFEQHLILIEKGRSGVTRRTTIPVRFVPMTGQAQKPPE